MEGNDNHRMAWLIGIVGAIALSGLLVLVGLNTSQASAEARPVLTGLTPDRVLSQPRQYLYQVVTVEGEIARVRGARMLALRDRSVRQGLLILLSDQAALPEDALHEGQSVEVTGVVRLMNREDVLAIEHRLGLDMHRDNLAGIYANDAYILATEIKPRTASRPPGD